MGSCTNGRHIHDVRHHAMKTCSLCPSSRNPVWSCLHIASAACLAGILHSSFQPQGADAGTRRPACPQQCTSSQHYTIVQESSSGGSQPNACTPAQQQAVEILGLFFYQQATPRATEAPLCLRLTAYTFLLFLGQVVTTRLACGTWRLGRRWEQGGPSPLPSTQCTLWCTVGGPAPAA